MLVLYSHNFFVSRYLCCVGVSASFRARSRGAFAVAVDNIYFVL